MNINWLIAVLLAAMASFISNLGVTLQKLHHLRAAVSGKPAESEAYHAGWMWRVGLSLVFFGSLADFAALSFGPQSLVAPLGSLTLVSNVIFAPLLLKETIGSWDVLATGLIIIGSSIAVVFGSHESVTYTVFQLFSFFARWDFILYALVVSIYIVLLYMAIQKMERIEKEEGIHSPRYLQYKAFHRFAYPSISGTVGAQSVLFAKCFVELLSNTIYHWRNGGFTEEPTYPTSHAASSGEVEDGTAADADAGAGGNMTDLLPETTPLPPPINFHPISQNMFVHWQTYCVFLLLLAAIFAQIKYLNDGLRRFDASYSVPVFTSFWIILSVVSGMIFYREYQGMDTLQCMMFAFGVAVTVTGVITLGGREQVHAQSNGHHHQIRQEDEEDEEDEEDGGGRSRRISCADEHGQGHISTDGSVNIHGSGKSSTSGPGGYVRGARVHSGAGNRDRGLSNGYDPHHPHQQQHHDDDSLEVDLDLEDEEDEHDVAVPVHGHHHAHHPNAAVNGHSPYHHHVNGLGLGHGHVAHLTEESSVTDGARAAVIEASQRISQAFNKLRGKGAREVLRAPTTTATATAPSSNVKNDSTNGIKAAFGDNEHLVSGDAVHGLNGINNSAGANSSSRNGHNVLGLHGESDDGTDVSADDASADPLIIKQARKSPKHVV